MLADIEEYLPVHAKELNFMMANIYFLENDHEKAKKFYRHVLKLAPKPQLEAMLLNNLAFASWMHLLDLPKLKPAEGVEETDDQVKLRDSILKDEKYVMSYFK